MALALLRRVLLMAAVMLTIDGVSARIQRPVTPWKAPHNTFAHAPIHTHTWEPPLQQGALPQHQPTTTVIPLHPSPYPFFHTLPYPLPRPLLCPGFGYPPYTVDQHGRLPPAALYQNIGRNPLPFFRVPFTIRCYPLPLPFPVPEARPHAVAPAPQ